MSDKITMNDLDAIFNAAGVAVDSAHHIAGSVCNGVNAIKDVVNDDSRRNYCGYQNQQMYAPQGGYVDPYQQQQQAYNRYQEIPYGYADNSPIAPPMYNNGWYGNYNNNNYGQRYYNQPVQYDYNRQYNPQPYVNVNDGYHNPSYGK